MKSREELVERGLGCLVGLACGDAMARPVAGLRAAEVARRYGEMIGYVDVIASENEPQRLALRGVHSALTAQSLALMDSLLYGAEGPSGPDLARRLTALSFPRNHLMPWGTLRGAPFAVVRALDSHARADDWRLAGVRNPDGSALLAAVPLGLLVGDSLDEVIDLCVDLTLVTHREPRSVAASAAMVGLVRHVVDNRKVSSRGLASAAFQACERACRRLSDRHLGVLSGSPSAAGVAMSAAIRRSETEPFPLDLDCRDAPDMLVGLLLSWLSQEKPLLETLSAVCAKGGAADLLAPAVGAIQGAQAGCEHLPLGLIDGLVARAAIEKRTRALLSSEELALPPLYDLEIELAIREGRWREARPPSPPSKPRSQLDLL